MARDVWRCPVTVPEMAVSVVVKDQLLAPTAMKAVKLISSVPGGREAGSRR
jgi:hypothetical protein